MPESLKIRKSRPGEAILYLLIYLCAAFSVALLALIIGHVLFRGIGQINWQFLTTVTSVRTAAPSRAT